MEFIRGLHNIRPEHRGCALTIGNYDGVHRGHQAVLAQLAERAQAAGLPTAVMLFEPQPAEFFQGGMAPPRLMRLRDKIEALRTQPVSRVICLRFDARLAALEAETFIDEILVRRLQVRYLVVGDDFRFGRNRVGNLDLLHRAGARYGFDATPMPSYQLAGERVSSTRIRAALAAGDFAGAARLLGRPYRMSGRVLPGDRIGRRIGIPTANLALDRLRSPLAGIFVVQAHGIGPAPLPAVASIGTRPTVGGTKPLLEVHVLDYDGDLYGKRIGVRFCTKLRDEQRFETLEAMAAQIRTDIDAARAYFRSMPNGVGNSESE